MVSTQSGHYGRDKMLRQFAAYFLFALILLTINYSSHSWFAHYEKQHAHTNFIDKTSYHDDESRNFTEIRNFSQYWDWLSDVAASSIHRDTLDPLAMSGHLLGVARLRQVRSQTVVCPATTALQAMSAYHLLALDCYGNPGWQEDTQSYLGSWNSSVGPNGTWLYQREEQTGRGRHVGQVSTYSGGGYVQDLGTNYVETRLNIEQLKESNWIDRGTRAVFLELTLYNANVQLYTVITLLMEFPVSGSAVPSYSLDPIQLFLLGSSTLMTLLTVCECLLLGVLCYFLCHILSSIHQKGTTYFLSPWSYVEIAIAALTVASFAIFVCNVVRDTMTYGQYLVDRGQHTSFVTNAYWNYVWCCVNGVLLFLLMLLIMKQLRFIKFLSKFSRTLRLASPKIVGCGLIFIMLVLFYSQLGYLWYGHIVYAFRGFAQSIPTMLCLFRGHTHFLNDMALVNQSFTLFFFFTFIALMFVVVFGLVLAVLANTYHGVKAEMQYHNTLEMQDYEMVDFMMKRFKKWVGISKPKPAFRHVRFQGMPSLSSRGTSSTHSQSWTKSSSSTDTNDLMLIDEEDSERYLNDLLNRAVPTWERMLTKLREVEDIEHEELKLEKRLEKKAQQISKPKPKAPLPVPPPKKKKVPTATLR